MQTRLQSIIEILINLSVGFIISLTAQVLIFPLFGWHISIHSSIEIGLWFTGTAFIRGLFFRRVFNYLNPVQKYHHSLLEVTINVFTGWLVAFLIQLIIFPVYNIHASIEEDIIISIIFTIISVIRGIYFRRLFNSFVESDDKV